MKIWHKCAIKSMNLVRMRTKKRILAKSTTYVLKTHPNEERDPQSDEKEDFKSWLGELRKLDPFRNGRWDDLEKTLLRS